jgi:hypothetical protein
VSDSSLNGRSSLGGAKTDRGDVLVLLHDDFEFWPHATDPNLAYLDVNEWLRVGDPHRDFVGESAL